MAAMPNTLRAALTCFACSTAAAVVLAACFPTRAYLGKIAVDLVICAVPIGCWLVFDRAEFIRRRRRRGGQCLHCGYDLHGNVSGVCPECGQAK